MILSEQRKLCGPSVVISNDGRRQKKVSKPPNSNSKMRIFIRLFTYLKSECACRLIATGRVVVEIHCHCQSLSAETSSNLKKKKILGTVMEHLFKKCCKSYNSPDRIKNHVPGRLEGKDAKNENEG